ncbi:Lopap [Frankliniella fusca]|uniref:Lopap n=1 Tax=Frankliniella fusca TaxID=407009 RepID=A0AAE1HUX9_9NEOP|nr:Lopap [Frankliniella fusca]
MLRYIALFALVACASAHFIMPKCPMVPGKFPFDMEKFHGDWYLTAGNDFALEKKGKCGKITFPTYAKDDKIEETVLSSRYTGVSIKDNTPIAWEAHLQPVVSDKIANFYSVFRAEGSNKYTEIYKQSIVASDYTHYALVLSCKTYFNAEVKNFQRALMAEIWTRQGVTLSQDTYNALTTQLASYGIDAAAIKHVEKC